MRFLASEAAAGIGARLVGPDVAFEGASFDTRSLEPGQLFVPLVADRNGHEFIGVAYEAGAACHLTSETYPFRRDRTALEVADTGDALLALAAWARQRSSAHVVGVTGSGPAYVFLLMECMAAAVERTGLSPEQARMAARQTILGAATLAEVLGDDTAGVTGVRLESTTGGPEQTIEAAGVFLAIGHTPNTAFLDGQLTLTDKQYIVWTQHFRTATNVEGVFAAGDVADDYYRQAISAAGTGCMAALDAERWLAAQGED